MKIKMLDAGESPEFGAYQAGDEIDDTRASLDTLKRLVERGNAEEIKTESATKARRREEKQDLNFNPDTSSS